MGLRRRWAINRLPVWTGSHVTSLYFVNGYIWSVKKGRKVLRRLKINLLYYYHHVIILLYHVIIQKDWKFPPDLRRVVEIYDFFNFTFIFDFVGCMIIQYMVLHRNISQSNALYRECIYRENNFRS